MKLTKYFMPFAALAVLASCSNDKMDGPAVDSSNGEGTVAAMFNVTLPSIDDTRAITANDFEDGDASEYKVNDITIYIFKTASGSEDNYTYVAASDTFYPAASNDPTADVTRKATITVQFPESELGTITGAGSNTYYGLCIVNKPEDFTEPSTTFGAWKETGTFTYADFKHNGGFTMTNAPTFDSQANDVLTNPHTLVALNADNFVKSPATPTNPAGTFFVQRGVAKVKIEKAASIADFNSIPSALDPTTQKFKLINWELDITNTVSYPVQNVANVVKEMADAKTAKAAWTNQSVSYFYTELTNANGTSSSDIRFNHIWWGKDPNYAATAESSAFNHVTTTPANAIASVTSDYCLENLMPYNGMNQDQTTRVVFYGQYSLDGTSFKDFIVATQNDKAIVLEEDMLLDTPAAGSGVALNTIVNEENYDGQDKGNFADYFTDGEISNLKVIALKLGIAETGTVDYYPGGYTYYVARVKHFDPTSETPWSTVSTEDGYAETQNGKTVYTKAHLGRYGMLRNNVYYVTINSVLGYGSPEIPTPDTDNPDPDDEIDPVKYNMNVEINILAWAKRNYGYDLK